MDQPAQNLQRNLKGKKRKIQKKKKKGLIERTTTSSSSSSSFSRLNTAPTVLLFAYSGSYHRPYFRLLYNTTVQHHRDMDS